MLIEDEIAKVRELLKKVTPGPWHTEPLQDERTDCHILAPEDNPQKYVAWACPMPNIEKRKANRDYIAAVNPAFMQALLDKIDRLQKLIKLWKHDYEVLADSYHKLNKEADWMAIYLSNVVDHAPTSQWREDAKEAVK